MLCFLYTDTMHSKAVVTKPQNVFIMRDVLLNGYIGGCNTNFFPSDPDEFHTALQHRLGLDEEYMTSNVHSLIPIPVPWQWTPTDVVGVSDRILPWTIARDASAQYSSFPGGRLVWTAMYKAGFDMTSVHYGGARYSRRSRRRSAVAPPAHKAPPACFQKISVRFKGRNSSRMARSTTPCASLARTAARIRSGSAGFSSFLAKATSAQTPSQANERARHPHLPCSLVARASPLRFFSRSARVPTGDARWRRGQSTTMEACRAELINGDMYSKGNVPYAVSNLA